MAEAEMTDAPPKELASNLTLDILQIVKVSQSQHGLRHGDHMRYRQYCTRRLARIYKALKFSHGRGRYQKRTLEPELVASADHLLIPLVSAERAWSYGMELKSDAGSDPRKRAHMIRRLKKATMHAAELVQLCKQLGSARTALEAEAYSSYIFGSFLQEQERDWGRALAKFMRARKAFEQLARVGGADQADVCRERIEELEPSLRYCTYKRGSGGGDESTLDAEDFAALHGDSGANDEMLKGLLAEDNGRTVSDAFATTTWRGNEIPVRNKEARTCVAAAAAQLAKIQTSEVLTAERGLAIYDKAFIAYNDARQHLRDEIASAATNEGGSESAGRLGELKLADRALAAIVLEKTIERNKFLVSTAAAKLSGEVKLEKGEKAPRSEDLVHLYNTLLRNYEELAESGPEVMRGTEGAPEVEESIRVDCMLEQGLLHAKRAAALASVHLGAGSHLEAAVLYARAVEHAERVQGRVPKSSDVSATAEKVKAEARKARCATLTEGILARVAQQKGLRAGIEGVSLHEGPAAAAEAQYLMDHLDQYKSAVLGKGQSKVHITPMPPRMTSISVSPIVLDVAGDEIVYPSLDERAGVKKTSTLRNLFSFGKR